MLTNTRRASTERAGFALQRSLEFFAWTSQPHEAADDFVTFALEKRGSHRTINAAAHRKENLHGAHAPLVVGPNFIRRP